MNIYMSAEDEAYVKAKVESGDCHSTSEVVLIALELLKEQDEVRRWKLERLRCDIQSGVDQLNTGQYKTYDAEMLKERFEQIKVEGRRRLAEYQKQETA